MYGPTISSCSPLLSSDATTLIKDQAGLREQWVEHFSNLLNSPSTVGPAALSQILQQAVQDELDLLPSINKIMKAIFQTNSGRTSGKDSIPGKIYKVVGPNTLEALHDVLQSVWEEMPDDLRDALIISLYKNKDS